MIARLSNMQNQSHGYVIILAERHDGIKKCKWFCINAMVGLNFLLPVERLIFICSYKNSSNAEFLIIFMRLMVPLLHSVTNFLRNNYWFFSAWIYYWEYARVENTDEGVSLCWEQLINYLWFEIKQKRSKVNGD